MIYKKILGTLALFVFVIGVIFSTYSFVNAGNNSQGNLQFDGIVTGISGNLITLDETTQISIDENTNFVAQLNFSDIETGDRLKINAKDTGSEIVAKVVKRISCGSGYGNGHGNGNGNGNCDGNGNGSGNCNGN